MSSFDTRSPSGCWRRDVVCVKKERTLLNNWLFGLNIINPCSRSHHISPLLIRVCAVTASIVSQQQQRRQRSGTRWTDLQADGGGTSGPLDVYTAPAGIMAGVFWVSPLWIRESFCIQSTADVFLRLVILGRLFCQLLLSGERVAFLLARTALLLPPCSLRWLLRL